MANLPKTLMFDSGVLFRALKHRQDKDRCCELLDLARKMGSEISIAAPTVAEMHSGTRGAPAPLVSDIVVLSYDNIAAELHGKLLPDSFIKNTSKNSKRPFHYAKYDSLIVATAKRWRIECMVTLDLKHIVPLCQTLGMRVVTPSRLLDDVQGPTTLPLGFE